MKVTKYIIAGGNPTLLVEDCRVEERGAVIEQWLGPGVDQIAFVSVNGVKTLDMMGGEMCVNATLAYARALGGSGEIVGSGFAAPVRYSNLGEETLITFPMEYTISDDIVLLPGIGFRVTEGKFAPKVGDLPYLCKEYQLPAFGTFEKNPSCLSPWIYVRDTQSTIQERACGSGSIALSLIANQSDITQFTGQKISVTRPDGNLFTVSAKVVNIRIKNGRY